MVNNLDRSISSLEDMLGKLYILDDDYYDSAFLYQQLYNYWENKGMNHE